MYEPPGRQLPHLAFLWPALAAASASELAGSIAKQFIGLAGPSDDRAACREPDWATPNTIALELKTVRLRDFSTAQEGVPTLLCAPYALHGAGIVDLAPGHSLVAALREGGLERLFVTHWRSADADMRFLCHRRLSRRPQRPGRPARRPRRPGRTLPRRLDVAALRRTLSRQGAQAGARRRPDRHRRRAIGTVRAHRRQPAVAVPGTGEARRRARARPLGAEVLGTGNARSRRDSSIAADATRRSTPSASRGWRSNFAPGMRGPSICPAPIISRSSRSCTSTTSSRAAASSASGKRSISPPCMRRYSCWRRATMS